MSLFPLTRRDLDGMTCAGPGCDHTAGKGHEMQMAGGCHPNAGTDATYLKGTIVLTCHQCHKYITTIGVAP